MEPKIRLQTGFCVSIFNQYGRMLGFAIDVKEADARKRANAAADRELASVSPLWQWRIAKTRIEPWFDAI